VLRTYGPSPDGRFLLPALTYARHCVWGYAAAKSFDRTTASANSPAQFGTFLSLSALIGGSLLGARTCASGQQRPALNCLGEHRWPCMLRWTAAALIRSPLRPMLVVWPDPHRGPDGFGLRSAFLRAGQPQALTGFCSRGTGPAGCLSSLADTPRSPGLSCSPLPYLAALCAYTRGHHRHEPPRRSRAISRFRQASLAHPLRW